MSKAGGTEHALRRKVSAMLGKRQMLGELWYMKTVGGPFQRAGIPDYLICIKGRLLALEIKRNGASVSEAQGAELGRLKRAGAETIVLDDFGQVDRWLNDQIKKMSSLRALDSDSDVGEEW